MTIPALTLIDQSHGFDLSGAGTTLNTDGYLALIPAFQQCFFADGRPWTSDIDTTGYHRLDFLHTVLVGTVTGVFTKGEVINQATSWAQAIFAETIGLGATAQHLVYRTTETEFDTTNLITGADSGATLTPTPIAEIQTLTPSIAATAGTFTLTFGGETTAAIAYNASTGDIKTAFELLTTIGTVTVGGTIFSAGTGGLTITFANTLGNVSAITIASSMTGAGSVAVTVAVTESTPGILGVISPPRWFSWDTAPSLLTYDYEGDVDSVGASPVTLIDASLATEYPTNDYLNNWYVYVKTGTGAGSRAVITDYVALTGTITVADWLDKDDVASTHPDANSTYGISETALETTGGIFPDGGSNIGCLCFGRIFLNSMLNPHQWFCSRVNEPYDWDSSQDDVAASTSSQNSRAGEVGDVITAMISYKDHYLIFGCVNEVWILRSDPLQGGVLTCLSKATGVFSPTSYCWDDKNNLYFLGTDGIYKLSSNAILRGQPPTNVTKQRLPKLVTSMELNRRTDRVTMAFDKQRYGVQVSISQYDGTWGVAFWLDIRTGGIFPDVFPAGTVNPSCLFYFDAVKASERGLLIGGYDGFVRKFDEAVKNDDDGGDSEEAIESYAAVGAFVSGKETRSKGMLGEVAITPGKATDSITVDVHRADNADELINNIEADSTPSATKTFTGDQPGTMRDKVSDRAIAIVIKNLNTDESFSIDSIDVDLKTSGKAK